MTDFKGGAVGHTQPKRHKRALAKLILDLRRPHDTPILCVGPACANPEYATVRLTRASRKRWRFLHG